MNNYAAFVIVSVILELLSWVNGWMFFNVQNAFQYLQVL